MSEANKDDGKKAPWHLLPFDALRGIVAVLGFGAGKYTKRYRTKWHSVLSAPFVKNVRVDTQTGCAVTVTRNISGQLILSTRSANGKTAEIGRSETPTELRPTPSVDGLASLLASEIGEPSGKLVSLDTASPKKRTRSSSNKVARSAVRPTTLTLTIATAQGSSEASFAASATTASECLEILWKDLSERFPICAAHSLEIAERGERNWEQGMAWSRPYAALLRHTTAWFEGEAKDPETGMSHLWHAGCCILFLIAYEIRGIGTDDRPGTKKGPP